MNLRTGPEKERSSALRTCLVIGVVLFPLGIALFVTGSAAGVWMVVLAAVFALCGGLGTGHSRKAEGRSEKSFDPDAPNHGHIKAPPPNWPSSPGFNAAARDHGHITMVSDDWVERQMRQLETMKQAGLVEEQEYRERKRKIQARR